MGVLPGKPEKPRTGMAKARREIRRLRRMLHALALADHYDPGCGCEGCVAHREVMEMAWKPKR